MFWLLKPRVLEDVSSRRRGRERINSFSRLPPRLNLSYEHQWRFPVRAFSKAAVIVVTLVTFVLTSAVAPTLSIYAANHTAREEERQELEVQLERLEAEINQYENQIKSYQKQGKSLKGEITKLNDKIAILNLRIKSINLTLSKLDKKISETQLEINTTESTIDRKKNALAELVRTMHQNEQAGMLEIFLKNPQISDFFSNLNNLALLQNNVRITISQITDLRNQLQDQRDQFALARADAATVKAYQLAQKTENDGLKEQKNTLLTVTKGQETKYQELLKKTKETAAQIRSRIFQLLGGGELTFEQAYKFAKLASQSTGVRPAFILAVLDRESALGQNVGRCTYEKAMNPKDHDVFLSLLKELSISPGSVTVSCPNADGAYGGAMGPAQFIPSTWRGYAPEVAKVTGHNPPSPWNNSDAFVAAALYLRDAGAAGNERQAAARYYCGSRWNRYVCTNVYGQKVIERAEQFQEDIETILKDG